MKKGMYMSASTKLSNSVKALCYLARKSPEPQSSATISRHTGLAGIGIITTTQGAAGGFLLARPPAEIDLQEIYCAIEDRKAFHLDVTTLPQDPTPTAAAVNCYFLDLFSEIQVEIEDKMKNISLAAVLDAIARQ
jgi:DNA-binding IscR family transcriptional regulator